eukprot:gene4770-6692_t
MNIKAEKIEQLIQIINRNLSLVYTGQFDGVTPLEIHELQRVDTVIFGHDKFAYEMVYFVKSAAEKLTHEKSIPAQWEANFIQGLETLLVECAVVNDDIERDCFVSRVYCWFNEKLVERRDLTKMRNFGFDDLRSTIKSLSNVNTAHTAKALENFHPNQTAKGIKESNALLAEKKLSKSPSNNHIDSMIDEELQQHNLHTSEISNNKFGSRKIPQYVKSGLPNILPAVKPDAQSSFLPKIPGAEENYGLIYNVPTTEAEKNMHEMWMARRRQEAFEWKTQQHLALVMDRLALHRSRLESDALRRQESTKMLKSSKSRPQTVNDDWLPNNMKKNASHERLREGDNLRSVSMSPHLNHRNHHNRNLSDSENSTSNNNDNNNSHHNNQVKIEADVPMVLIKNGTEKETSILKPARSAIPRQNPLPMKFRTELPNAYQQHYLQISDSDDEDKPERIPISTLNKSNKSTTGKAGNKKKGNNTTKVEIVFKHERPVVRERPQSAKQFRDIASNDPEFKIHYRHTNYRRMPLTEFQEKYLEEKELARVKKSEEMAKDIAQAFSAKNDKKGGKDAKGKDKDKSTDKNKTKPGSAPNPSTTTADGTIIKQNKYKSADQFMAVHFPNFESQYDSETIGPMRLNQLMEVDRIYETCQNYNISIKQTAIKKALLIPQDKPEAICLEGLRETGEGLMINPNPSEYWRKFNMKITGGGKKKKKRSKK